MSESVGEQLRNARLERQLTLEQAAQATRIRSHYLEALETGKKGVLPSAVQEKGFLGLYADFLGLKPAAILAAWEGKAKEEPYPATIPLPDERNGSFEDSEESAPAPQQGSAPINRNANDNDSKTDHSLPVNRKAAIPTNTSPARAIFIEVGETLRLRRESISVPLDEVERFTKVRLHYLKALESGDLEILPSPVQARGMLANYATFLDLDPDVLLGRYAEALQLRREERAPAPAVSAGKRPSIAQPAGFLRRYLTPDLLVGFVIVLFLVAFGVITASQLGNSNKEQIPTPPSISEILLNTTTPDPVGTSASNSAPAGSVSSPAASTPATTSSPAGLVTTATIPAVGSGPIHVTIIASQRAWMQITVDGKVVFSGRVTPGNAYAYSGEKKVELLTGSAGALQVLFNDTDLGTIGQVSEVKGMIFTLNAVTTPTPAFSATPSPTEQPTATLQATPTIPTPTITPFIP